MSGDDCSTLLTTIWEYPIVEVPGIRMQRICRRYWVNGPSASELREVPVLRIIKQILRGNRT
jgi:hypothetical protein